LNRFTPIGIIKLHSQQGSSSSFICGGLATLKEKAEHVTPVIHFFSLSHTVAANGACQKWYILFLDIFQRNLVHL
jgi:hypothetical protein